MLNYILRPALPLKHLSYVESTGEVRYSSPRAAPKVWEHAYDFLADWVQHIPRARQHQVTYAGHFANALGNLNLKPESTEETDEPKGSKPSRWVKWRTLILRCWAVDPELCPKCGKEMKRSKASTKQHELQRLLNNLGIGLYPARPRSPPPPSSHPESDDGHFSDCDSRTWALGCVAPGVNFVQGPTFRIPEGWDQWDAA